MAKAAVFTNEHGEPVNLTNQDLDNLENDLFGGNKLEDVLPEGVSIDLSLDIVSEWSLRVAVRALQHIYNTSACPGSRAAADLALRGVGLGGDLETSPEGKPVPIHLRDEERPDKIDPTGNPMKLWGP